MPGTSVTVLLPYQSAVVVQSFVNAAWAQRVTIAPQGGSPIVFSGSGYYDTPIGQQTINTPAGTDSGYPVAVNVDHSQDGGQTWQPSTVDWVDCQVMYLHWRSSLPRIRRTTPGTTRRLISVGPNLPRPRSLLTQRRRVTSASPRLAPSRRLNRPSPRPRVRHA